MRVLAGKLKMSRRTSRASFGGLVSVALPPPGRLEREPEQENKRETKGKTSAVAKAQASGVLKAQASAVPKARTSAVPKAQPNGGARKSTIPKPPQPKRSIAPTRPSLKPTEHQPRPSSVLNRASSQFGTGSGRLTIGGAAALDRRGSRSSLYGQGGVSQIKKDPRPLSDKPFQSRSIKRILAFLRENGYPRTLTYQNLQSPSGKEFCGIFNFIIEKIEPSMVITGVKMEEEVPRTLGYFGYPFNVAKSCLKSVGSPHAWPILIGVLIWLIDLCLMDLPSKVHLDCFPQDFEDDGTGPEELFSRSMVILYRKFMNVGEEGEDFQQELRVIRDGLQVMYDATAKEHEELEQENEGNKLAIAQLSESKIPPLTEELEGKQTQLTQYGHWIEAELKCHVEKYANHCQEIAATITETENSIAEAKSKIKELEGVIQAQPLSADEAQRLYEAKEEAEKMISEQRLVEQERVRVRNEVLMRYNDGLREVTAAVKQINEKVQWLSASLGSRFTVLDYEKSGSRSGVEAVEKLTKQSETLKDELEASIDRVAHTLSDCDTKLVTMEENRAALQEEVLKRQLEVAALENTQEIKMRELERKEKVVEDRMKSEAEEKQLLEKRRNDIMLVSSEVEIQAGRELAEARRKYELRKQEMAEELHREVEELKGVLDEGLAFMEASKKLVQKKTHAFTEELNMLKSVKVTAVSSKYFDAEELLKAP